MRSIRFVVAVLVLFFVAGSALHSEPEKKSAPSYSKDIQPFLKKYCVECHQESQAKGGIDVTTYSNLTEGSGKKKKKVVVPSDPDASRLVRTMEGKGKQMPPRKYKLQPTKDEIKLVREWIAGGATNDTAPKTEK